MEIKNNIKKTKKLLSKVFRELRKKDILALQNFTCCLTCGTYAMEERIKQEGYKGWVFYHAQDKEYYDKKGMVYLAFSDAVTGRTAYDELRKHGLKAVWDFDESKRICVEGINRNI